MNHLMKGRTNILSSFENYKSAVDIKSHEKLGRALGTNLADRLPVTFRSNQESNAVLTLS